MSEYPNLLEPEENTQEVHNVELLAKIAGIWKFSGEALGGAV
jgi:hypothetical protein